MDSTDVKAFSGRATTVEALWERGLGIFYDDMDFSKEKITDHTTLEDTKRTLEIVQTDASKQYGSHEFKVGQKHIKIRLSRIMKRLDLLSNLGDAAMKAAPETVSVVWSAFRMLFKVFRPRPRPGRRIARLTV